LKGFHLNVQQQEMDNSKKPSSLTFIFVATLVCLFIGFVAVLLVYRNPGRGDTGQDFALPTPIPNRAAVDNPAPEFTARSMDGSTISLRDFEGRVVIVNFWTTWCPSCVAELPVLQEVDQRYSDQEVVVLAVDIGERESDVRRFLDDNDLDLTVLLDRSEEIAYAYNIRSIPTAIIVDPYGEIDAVHLGAASASQLDEYITAAMGDR
jgi:thiol-disulfide isomerase/thioredoxin